MSDWAYVTIAYVVGWGSLAAYAVILARRVSQARRVARSLGEVSTPVENTIEQDSAICDAHGAL